MGASPVGQIRTVLGYVPADQLGAVDTHTHVIRDGGVLVEADRDFLLHDVKAACEEVLLFRKAGGRAVADMMPAAPGRNASLLAHVSAATGVHIIAATGFVPWALESDSPAWGLPEDELADLLVAEIHVGIDAGNYGTAPVRRLAVRAGIIKISLENDRPSAQERTFIRAAAQAHCLTGVPISVHTLRGTGILGLLELLADLGVDSSSVLVAHVFQSGDFALLERIAATGAFLIMDGAGKPQYDERTLATGLHRLVEAGYIDRLLLASDFSRRRYWKSYGGEPGFDYLVADFVERLVSSGLPAMAAQKMLVDNPARALAVRPMAARERSFTPTFPDS